MAKTTVQKIFGIQDKLNTRNSGINSFKNLLKEKRNLLLSLEKGSIGKKEFSVRQFLLTSGVSPETSFTVAEAADFLSVPVNTCEKLCLDKIIPSYNAGNLRKLKLLDIVEYMEGVRVEAANKL